MRHDSRPLERPARFQRGSAALRAPTDFRVLVRVALVTFAVTVCGLAAAQATKQSPAQPVTTQALTTQPLATQQFVCRGNEPFWRLDIGADNAMLRRLGETDAIFRGQLTQFGFLDPEWAVWRGRSRGDSRSVIVATLRAGSCRDTMSDEPPFAWRALVSLDDGRAVTGCCSARRGLDIANAPLAVHESKPTSDWSRLLPEMLPAIRACTLDANLSVAQILKAWPMNRGKAGVRVLATNGKVSDCVVDLGTSRIDSVESVAAGAAPLPGQGNPVFLPARESPPQVRCGRIERAVGKGGRTDGYLVYDPC